MLEKLKKHKTIISIAILLLAWGAFFLLVDPVELVEKIGVENTYIIVFLMAVFGGLSTITGSSFFVTVATFASSGADPLLLGLSGGLGIFISDIVFFFLAKYGVKAFEEKSRKVSSLITRVMDKLTPAGVLAGTYLYLGFTPLPNDLLMIALALSGMSFKRLMPVLFLGSITVVTLTAYFWHTVAEVL